MKRNYMIFGYLLAAVSHFIPLPFLFFSFIFVALRFSDKPKDDYNTKQKRLSRLSLSAIQKHKWKKITIVRISTKYNLHNAI